MISLVLLLRRGSKEETKIQKSKSKAYPLISKITNTFLIRADCDIKMSGHVTWAGGSSTEVRYMKLSEISVLVFAVVFCGSSAEVGNMKLCEISILVFAVVVFCGCALSSRGGDLLSLFVVVVVFCGSSAEAGISMCV